MLEANNVAFLRLPSLQKLRSSCCRHESNPIRSKKKITQPTSWKRREFDAQFAFPLMCAMRLYNLCFPIPEFLLKKTFRYRYRKRAGGWYWEYCAHFVFEISSCSSRMILLSRVAQDDAFPSFIDHILQEYLQMVCIPTYLTRCYFYMLPFLSSQVCNLKVQWIKLQLIQGGRQRDIPNDSYRSAQVPLCVGQSNTIYLNFVQSIFASSTLPAIFNESWKLSRPNLSRRETQGRVSLERVRERRAVLLPKFSIKEDVCGHGVDHLLWHRELVTSS